MDFLTFLGSDLARQIRAGLDRINREGRLAWLLRQIGRRDLDDLPNGQWHDLTMEVKAFAATWGAHHQLAELDLSREQVRAMLDKAAEGIRLLFDLQTWAPEDVVTTIGPESSGAKKPPKPPKDAIHDGKVFRLWVPIARRHSTRTATIDALFDLEVQEQVLKGALKIRRCPRDMRFFIPVRRQRYCSAKCTQDAMNERKARRRGRPAPRRLSVAERKTKARALKAAAQHRAGLPHDRTVCPTCASQTKGR
jgi:hypothetical protein